MNVRTATLLSIAGVLAAGTAAVAVNTQVLSGATDPAEVPSALTLPVATQVFTVPAAVGQAPNGRPVMVDVGSDGSVAVLAATDLPTDGAPSARPNTSTGSTSIMSFQIGEAATATVDAAGGVLTILDVAPSPGWTVTEARGSGTVRLEFELTSSSTKVNFGAFLSGGEVLTSISSESLASTTSGEYDDDDDDHEDEDHEEEDHEHEDHDDDHDRGDDDD